jgi:hypothetical protein
MGETMALYYLFDHSILIIDPWTIHPDEVSFNSVLLSFMLDVCHCLIVCHFWVLLGLEDWRLSIYVLNA